MDYLESEHTIDEYITIFWKCNRQNNNYLDRVIDLCNNINNLDLSLIENKEDSLYDTTLKKYRLILDDFNKYINSITNLRESLNNLLKEGNINKLKKYENNYNIKVNKIYDFIKLNKNYNVDNGQFIKFMHNNTPEGRIIKQNNGALLLLDIIGKTITIDKLIKQKVFNI